MKLNFALFVFMFVFNLNTIFAQSLTELGHNFADDLISIVKANFQTRAYDPLAASKLLTKSEIVSDWDTISKTWKNSALVSVQQNNTCSQVQSISTIVSGVENKDSFIYINNRLVERRSPDFQTKYMYVGTRAVPDTIRQTDTNTGDNLLALYTYDANNLPASALVKLKYGANFIDTLRATYKHNTAGQLTYFREEEWGSSQQRWKNIETDSIFYNSDNKFTRVLLMDQSSDGDTLAFTYTYDANKKLTQIVFAGQSFTVGKVVVPTNRYHYSGFPLELVSQEYNGVGYDSTQRFIFAYNGALSVTSITAQTYENKTWYNSGKEEYTYCGQRVDVSEKQMLEAQLSLSPNPTTDQLSLRLDADNPSMVVQIFDTTGKMVLQKQHNQMEVDIPVAHLVEGMYIVKVQSGDYLATKKFVKL